MRGVGMGMGVTGKRVHLDSNSRIDPGIRISVVYEVLRGAKQCHLDTLI